jgi:hypothetical protein
VNFYIKMSNLKCLYLVDKLSYVQENCFQSQLFSAIRYGYDVTPVELFPRALFGFRSSRINLDKYDRIISVLRLRTLSKYWPLLKSWLNGRPITIYDQDPWESYIDNSPIKGVYLTLLDNLNLERVFVTAPWWARKLIEDGLPAQFVRMGMSPGFCSIGPKFEDRSVSVGFRGALHEHRKIIFNQLNGNGVQVVISRDRLAYPEYLDYLQQLKFFAHDESALPWVCDGVPIPRSTGMWIKSIETVARGTFCLRNYHEEGEAYNISSLPLVRCYSNPDEAPEVINSVMAMSPQMRRELQFETVTKIRAQYDWLHTAVALVSPEGLADPSPSLTIRSRING